MYRLSISHMGMTAQEFEQSTPLELQWRLEGARDRENRWLEKLATLACWVLNPWRGKGKPIRPSDLVKIEPRKG